MASGKHTAAFLSFFLLMAGIAPVAVCSEPGTSFGVGAIVVPRVIDASTLPQSVRQADAQLPGYARQWYIARINLQAGRSIDSFVSWSRQALTERWSDQEGRDDVYRLLLASQRELMESKPNA